MIPLEVAKINFDSVYLHTHPYHWFAFRMGSVLAYFIIGASFYCATEEWSVIDSFYFVTVSVSTVGYGDYYPTNDLGRVFTALFLIIGFIFVLRATDEFAKFGVIKAQNWLLRNTLIRRSLLERSMVKLAMSLAVAVILATVSVVVLMVREGWTGAEAFYWTVCTMATVGYGDLEIKRASTRVFAVVLIACSMVLYATTIHNINEFYALKVLAQQKTDPRCVSHISETVTPCSPDTPTTTDTSSTIASSNNLQQEWLVNPLPASSTAMCDTLHRWFLTAFGNNYECYSGGGGQHGSYSPEVSYELLESALHIHSSLASTRVLSLDEEHKNLLTVSKNRGFRYPVSARKVCVKEMNIGTETTAEMLPADATLLLLEQLHTLHCNNEIGADVINLIQKYRETIAVNAINSDSSTV